MSDSAALASETAAEFRAAFRETARAFLSDRARSQVVRQIVDGGDDGSGLWQAMVELGWTGVEMPEAEGGLGAGMAELAVLLEEAGRAVAPVPLLGAAVLGAGGLLGATGHDQVAWRRRLAGGEVIVTAALTGARGVPGELDVLARRDGEGHMLEGVCGFVPDLARADAVIVAAVDADSGATRAFLIPCDADGVAIEPQSAVDRTRSLARLTLASVSADPATRLAEPDAADQLVGLLIDRAALAVAADCVGGAERVLELTLDHLRNREQFGRPLGSFQALKHRCADMFLALTGARSAVEHAAAVIEAPAERPLAVSIAKSYAGEAYGLVASEGVQMHGGIGFTWEHDLHLYLKRAKLNEALFGDAAWHRDRIDSMVFG